MELYVFFLIVLVSAALGIPAAIKGCNGGQGKHILLVVSSFFGKTFLFQELAWQLALRLAFHQLLENLQQAVVREQFKFSTLR